MNAKDATRSIFTLGRFQILAQAFKKLEGTSGEKSE